MESKEKIIESLRRNGFRVTPQRIAIAEVVSSSKVHPTAEQVFMIVKRTFPSISRSTVYNTLNSMSDARMIQELAFNNTNRYDSNTSVHINLVCLNCGDIIDVESKTLEAEVCKISKRRMFSVTGYRFDIYGVCQKCEKGN